MRGLFKPECEWRLNIRIACLAAALAQILWSLLIVDPQAFGTSGAHGFDWTGGLMFLESLVLLIFFLAASWSSKRFIGSVKVKYAALIVALCLAVENLRPPYGMLRGIVRSSVDSLAWRYYPFIQARRILVAAIPSLAVVSILTCLSFLRSFLLTPRKLDRCPLRERAQR